MRGNFGSKSKTTCCHVEFSPVFSIRSALELTGESIETTAVRFPFARKTLYFRYLVVLNFIENFWFDYENRR
jgi:hypothetical protein